MNGNGTDNPVNDMPTLEDFQHWTHIMGRAQQLLMEFAVAPENQQAMGALWQHWAKPENWTQMAANPAATMAGAMAPEAILRATGSLWEENLKFWQNLSAAPFGAVQALNPEAERDRRFAAPEWQAHPLFALIRQSYAAISAQLLSAVDAVDGVDPQVKAQLRFATQGFVDAMSPSNFALTNPLVIKRTVETRGENLLKGLEHMLSDARRGQLTHVDLSKFEVGVNIATTPGKVVHETPLFQLIHYAPTTDTVLETPLVIFPPWINRYYILDLNPQKSFVSWCVEQGVSTFIVSWKSADESMKDVVWDDYIAAQIEAIDVIRSALDVPAVHAIGYCVAGTTLAATLAILAARDEAAKVASATFFTAQVDFELAGDLKLMVDDAHLKLIESLSAPGYLDGRYMAASFNALRGRDLIWNYVVNNYLLGEDYPPFDLLYWNGDTTNLPAKWHQAYLRDLYRDNKLVVPGAMRALDTPIDLGLISTPAYVQAGREDHIAPPDSVWRLMDHLRGEKQFVLAGSGHIAGVVNPPASGKYQYWTNDADAASLAEFVDGATEIAGSWWPHWMAWLRARNNASIAANDARKPGKGTLKPIENAPGRYVKSR